MDGHRVVALFGAVAALTVARPGKVMRISFLEMGQRFDGGGDFSGVCMWCTLWVCCIGCKLMVRLAGISSVTPLLDGGA